MVKKGIHWGRNTHTDSDGGWLGWVLIAILLFACACCVVFFSGCAGAQFAVSLEADRKLTASARSNAVVVLDGARAAGDKPTTVQLLEGVVSSLGTIQAGPIGVSPPTPWPQAVRDTVAAEQRCEPQIVVNDRIVQDPTVVAALAQERGLREAFESDSRRVHGQLQIAEGLVKESASKWSGEAVATAVAGAGGPLGALLLFVWRKRKEAMAAALALSDTLQEVKGDRAIAEIVEKHAPKGSAQRKTMDAIYEKKKPRRQFAQPEKPLTARQKLAALKARAARLLRRKT